MNARVLLRTLRPKRLLIGLVIGLATALCGLTLAFTSVGNSLERTLGLDWLFKIRGAVTPPADVLVVGINGRTGRTLDLPKLPRDWPRTVHADVINKLVERNVAVIVFDFDFSRPKPGEEDRIFANAIAEANRVILFEWLAGRRERVFDSSGTDGGWTWVEEKQPPTEVLARAARALAPFPLPKLGQSAFEFWTFKPSAGDAPTTAAVALQLKALSVYDEWVGVLKSARAPGAEELPARAALITPGAVRELMLKLRQSFRQDLHLRERVDRELTRLPFAPQRLLAALADLYAGPDHYYLNFYGQAGTIHTIPYEALITNSEPYIKQIRDLTNVVVFVGYSDLHDPDQPDRFFTSVTNSDGVDLSGVEIMATAYSNLLTQRTVRPSSALLTILLVGSFGLIIGSVAYLLSATIAVPSVFAATGLYGTFVLWRFTEADTWLPLTIPLIVQFPTALLLGLLGQYILGRRKERQIARAVSYYLPENIARDLTEREIDPESVNKVVFGTCLATDMSGFTTLSESKSPGELAAFMNEYFDTLAKVLKQHAVDVTEFHADTIMCAWTAPTQTPEVCQKALHAAVDVSEAIKRFALEHGSLPLNARIGLQDGHFYLGHTGGGGRFQYSILGDTANTAARLESLNKQLGTHILAAESVVRNSSGLLVRPLGTFQLSGKADTTSVVEVLGRRSTATKEQLALSALFVDALAVFRSGDWVAAGSLFEAMTDHFNGDGPSQLLLGVTRRYAADPPTDSDPFIVRLDVK